MIIADNAANNDNVNIHASIYCQTGGFGAEDYSHRPVSGDINLLGGIIQDTRAAVGTFSGSNITHGFSKRYKYDNRLMLRFPAIFILVLAHLKLFRGWSRINFSLYYMGCL